MGDITPPPPPRQSGPAAPTREVKRTARPRDHQSDHQAAPVGRRPDDHHRDRQDQNDPAVVVSHPTAEVTTGEQITGRVVELTPKNQPVLMAGSLKLLIERTMPLSLGTEVGLTFIQVAPDVTARIDTLDGGPMPAETRVPVLVLARGTEDAPARPTTYAPPTPAVQAKLMRGNGKG